MARSKRRRGTTSNPGQVGLDWQVAGFGDFNGDGTTDMMLRNVTTGTFELYDIQNNQVCQPACTAQNARSTSFR